MTFVLESETLYVRVQKGFRPAMVGMRVIPVFPEPPNKTTLKPLTLPPVFPTQPEGIYSKHKLHLIASNVPFTGNMRGISGADHSCYRESHDAGLSGTYRAFLASKLQDLSSIVHRPEDRRLPVVNLKNQVLFNSWAQMFDGQGAELLNRNAPIYSFNGVDVMQDPRWPLKSVWIGSDETGQRSIDSYCRGWHSNAMDATGSASSLHEGKLVQPSKYSCSSTFIVLCIEISGRREFK
jgi:hypothetical protein